jgi:23S rRNA (guanosine2251-2'-O)-methyltransferase
MHTNKLIYETDFKMPTGLVIGSEGFGMRKTIKDKCDILVRIPMGGRIGSLNASVSAAIFLYEIFRQKNV